MESKDQQHGDGHARPLEAAKADDRKPYVRPALQDAGGHEPITLGTTKPPLAPTTCH
jgi:hypothetical protein